MLEIIEQETISKEGNDCWIEDCYAILKCHGEYIVMNIHKISGWCRNGIEIRNQIEFDNLDDATEYYNGDLRN